MITSCERCGGPLVCSSDNGYPLLCMTTSSHFLARDLSVSSFSSLCILGNGPNDDFGLDLLL